jgi:hypothetical protein
LEKRANSDKVRKSTLTFSHRWLLVPEEVLSPTSGFDVYPSKKTAQRDMTAETALKFGQKNKQFSK